MQKYTPKTDEDNGRNNSRRNYEDSRKIRKRSKQEEQVYSEKREDSKQDSWTRKTKRIKWKSNKNKTIFLI